MSNLFGNHIVGIPRGGSFIFIIVEGMRTCIIRPCGGNMN